MSDEKPVSDAPKTPQHSSKKMQIGTLLPPADIHVFSSDEHSLTAFDAMSKDWRFARVKISIEADGLDQAIEHYKTKDSPDLIIIQTDRTDDVLEKGLEKLSAHCEENTTAVIIGPVNDVRLYRSLMCMGISDYLVAPVPLDDLISAIGHILLDLKGTLGSQLISVIGTKGGVGTSTIAQLISFAMTEKLEQKTLLMDAAAGHSTLWSLFEFKPSRTIIEAAKAAVDRNQEELEQIMIKINDHLSVMNSGAERILDNPVALQAYNMLLDRMLYLFPYVVVDLSAAPKLLQRELLSRSQSIFVTSTPTLTSLSMFRSLKKEIEDLRGGEKAPMTLICNKTGQAAGAEVPPKDLADMIDIAEDHIVQVDYDAKFFLGLESEGTHIEHTKQGQNLIAKFASILSKELHLGNISSNSLNKEASSALGGLLGMLKGK